MVSVVPGSSDHADVRSTVQLSGLVLMSYFMLWQTADSNPRLSQVGPWAQPVQLHPLIGALASNDGVHLFLQSLIRTCLPAAACSFKLHHAALMGWQFNSWLTRPITTPHSRIRYLDFGWFLFSLLANKTRQPFWFLPQASKNIQKWLHKHKNSTERSWIGNPMWQFTGVRSSDHGTSGPHDQVTISELKWDTLDQL